MKKVNINIIAFNGLQDNKYCLESIFKHTPKDLYNLLLIDNGSTDGTTEYFDSLKHIDNVTVFHTGKNLGFPGGNNVGLRTIKEGHVLLLNNDTVVTPGWLEKMTRLFDVDETIGLVGPVTNAAPGTQQINVTLDQKNSAMINAYADRVEKENCGAYRVVERIVGFCFLIKEELFQKAGLLDERFGVGSWEDDDYCMQATSNGYKISVADDCFVYHYGSKAYKDMGFMSEYCKIVNENGNKFREKWGRTRALDKTLVISKNPKVSIVTPCYNYGEFLDQCVDSVLNQTHKNIEMIIVDDASTDDKTKDIVLKQTEKSNKIKTLFNGKRLGPAICRNLAISHSKGKYILPLDADDYLAPTCVEEMLKHIETNDVVHCGAQEFGDYDQYSFTQFNINKMTHTNHIFTTSMFSKKLWESVGGYYEDVSVYEDWVFWVSAISKGYRKFYGVDKPLFFYRKHGETKNKQDAKGKQNTIKQVNTIKEKYQDFFKEFDTTAQTPTQQQKIINAIPIKSRPKSYLRRPTTTVVQQQTQARHPLSLHSQHLWGNIFNARNRLGNTSSYDSHVQLCDLYKGLNVTTYVQGLVKNAEFLFPEKKQELSQRYPSTPQAQNMFTLNNVLTKEDVFGKVKVLYIPFTNNPNYGLDTIYYGLTQVLGVDGVYELGKKGTLHGEQPTQCGNYPCCYNLPDTHCITASNAISLINSKKFDCIIYCFNKKQIHSNFQQVFEAANSTSTPLVMLDQEDEFLYDDFLLEKHNFKWVFKREMLVGAKYDPRVWPLPFSYSDCMLDSSNPNNKTNSTYWVGKMTVDRNYYLNVARKVTGQQLNNPPCPPEQFKQNLKMHTTALNLYGWGSDTVRYWEIPGNMCAMITPPVFNYVPNDFTNDEAIFFNNWFELKDIVESGLLQDANKLNEIATNGFEKIKKYHTSSRRALELLSKTLI